MNRFKSMKFLHQFYANNRSILYNYLKNQAKIGNQII